VESTIEQESRASFGPKASAGSTVNCRLRIVAGPFPICSCSPNLTAQTTADDELKLEVQSI
jgi:hypothetical protein